jgi:hypothetical protein
MANQVKGTVTVPFNGGQIALAMTFNAICALEDHCGKTIGEVLADFVALGERKLVDMRLIRSVIWVGMLKDQPAATLIDAGNLCEALGVDRLNDTVTAVFETSGLLDADPDAGDTGNAEAGKPKKPA